LDEFMEFYKTTYKKKAILAYWDECKPAKVKSPKKTKAKAKGKAKPETETEAETEAEAATEVEREGEETEIEEAKEKVSEEKDSKNKTGQPRRRKAADPEEVLKRIATCRVVPVIKLEDSAHAVPLCKALKDGDIDVAEITFRTDCAGESVRLVCKELEDVCVGAGTVMTPKQVDEAIDGGADFIVSPGFTAAVCRRCRQRNALYLPGVVTPTEVMTVSSKFGLKALKFFPASCYGGVGTLKAFSSVFPDIVFMPTGGVSESNIHEFVSLPNVVAAGGSWMVAEAKIKAASESGDWSSITDLARSAREKAKA